MFLHNFLNTICKNFFFWKNKNGALKKKHKQFFNSIYKNYLILENTTKIVILKK